MKKLLLFTFFTILSTSLFSQAQFFKGITVGKGGNVVTIDSIIKSTTFIKFYEDATELLAIDTTTMLIPYIERKDTLNMLSPYARKASPVFTGVPKISADTVATRSYARTYGGTGIVTIDAVRTEINDSLDVLRPLYTPIADSMAYPPGSGIPIVTSGTSWGTTITDNSTNWNTAYSDRMKWDGGILGLTAATGRASLGATDVGSAFFTLTNPLTLSYARINANNTITTRSVTEVKTDLSLDNVTNESKATIFTSPTFTGTVTIPTPFTLGSVSVTSTGTQLNYLSGTTGTTGTGNLVLSVAPAFTGHPTIEGVTSTGATGTGNLVFSASPTLSGTVALGTGSLTMTGSLATTGSRVLKGWFTDLEITNLPTVNGNTFKSALSLTSSDVGLGNVTNESKATMFTSPAFTGNVPTTGGIPMSRVYSDTMKVSAGVLRTKVTTITTEPYSVQIFTSGGKDITHAVSDSVALNGGVYKLYVYSVDALTGCKLKILY